VVVALEVDMIVVVGTVLVVVSAAGAIVPAPEMVVAAGVAVAWVVWATWSARMLAVLGPSCCSRAK
jgi:hypothetical protein